MASKILWAAESVGDLLTTELNNLADATMVVDGTDYDNATSKFTRASFFFFGTFDAACDADAVVEVHAFYKLDATHYGDGEDGDVAAAVGSANSLLGLMSIGADSVVYQQLMDVPILPFAFRAGLKLNTGQALTAADTHWLKMYPYNHESQ